jgi:hypothetical protein
MKNLFDSKFYFLTLVAILLSFLSLYIITRPAILNVFDFSNTGSIGDTIGGITAPIINLIGALLVYITFKEQFNANKIQLDLLNLEIENQKNDRNFHIILKLFDELKNDFRNLNNANYKGTSAINAFVNKFDDTWTDEKFWIHLGQPIYSEFKFILSEYELISVQLIKGNIRDNEKSMFKPLLINYFISHLENPTNQIYKQLKRTNKCHDIQALIERVEKLNTEIKQLFF